jgi:hypothetical protein
MVVFDATMLMLLINPECGCPLDSSTGKPIEHAKERIEFLIKALEKSKTKIGIPTPALSEALVKAGSSRLQFVEKIGEFSVFEALAFDQLSAIEVAAMTKSALDSGDKKAGSSDIWSKVKYDRQIVAIARVRNATAIYTDDGGLRNLATASGLPVVCLADLEIPPEKAQGELPLQPPTERSDDAILDEIEDIREAEAGNPGSI